jgi:hypothetical protein
MSDVAGKKERLAALTKRLRLLKDEKDNLEAALKAINKECKEIQEKLLPALMTDAEIEKATIAGAGTVYIKQELYVSMAKAEDGDEAPFYDWARANAPDLVVEYIHPARLKSWAKEMLETGRALPDNSLKATFVPTATLLRR